MRLAIVGATGGVGSQVLEQAVAAGHDVTAIVRDPRGLSANGVRVVAADLASPDPATLVSAVAGSDAVVSALGPRSNAEAGVAARGTRALADAMRAAGVRRIVAISAAPVATLPTPGRPEPPRHDPGDAFLVRSVLAPILRIVFRAHYADLALMEDVLAESRLDWTVVRPPRLTGKPLTGRYRIAVGRNVRRGMSVSRADLAHAMLRVLAEPDTIRRTIGVAY
jgi:putative NADH-flavin reductase